MVKIMGRDIPGGDNHGTRCWVGYLKKLYIETVETRESRFKELMTRLEDEYELQYQLVLCEIYYDLDPGMGRICQSILAGGLPEIPEKK